MLKKAIISGIVFSSILLAGCNGKQNEEQSQVEMTEVLESKQDVVALKNGENDKMPNLLSELQNKIRVSIAEQTAIEADSIVMMLDGGTTELTCSVGLPKNVKIDDTLIKQIVDDSIKNVSETENVTIENTKIIIEKY
ncbi:topoisomerase [Lysinibacillus sp. RC79]|uniref:topoisomerase n=1 Tax=Lysinibacillus sp. RC79 TaxID=3156296 RepID=UPI0035160990